MIEYSVKLIGIQEEMNSAEVDCLNTYFNYEDQTYININNININQLQKDLKKVNNFYLKIIPDSTKTLLKLYFSPDFINVNINEKYKCRQRIIDLLFTLNISEKIKNSESISINSLQNESALKDFYQKLSEAHLDDDLINFEERVQHQDLIPILRPYQIKAVTWMLNRELKNDYLPSEYIQIKFEESQNTIFYYNPRTLSLIDYNPGEIVLPTGGILADEMGLGKTVEMLSLILCNENKIELQDNIINLELDSDNTPLKCETINTTNFVQCICFKTLKTDLITCSKCYKIQHRDCVFKNNNIFKTNKDYICPSCWKYEKPVNSSATIIITPCSIKYQWQSEVIKHIKKSDFKILIYDGVSTTGWINPNILAQYDVVVTDYNVMRTELHHSHTNEKKLRHERRYMKSITPLPLVKWWRVVLDEAQMVETPTNNCSKMIKTLPAVHRWSVTGTPIEKNINNLYGLIYFLDCEPYNDIKCFATLTQSYNNGNAKPLFDFLKKIMWRTCKCNVIKELNIPEQTELVHYVRMNDIQTFYYRDKHNCCLNAFNEKVEKIGQQMSMSKMTIDAFTSITEPLRQLRKDCIIPSILQRTVFTDRRTVNSKELLEHLITTNENKSKIELRTIVSSLNGLGGISLVNNEYDESIKYYKSVLNYSNKYKDHINVDTLLKIHAITNLLDAYELKKIKTLDEEKELLLNELNIYECKYIDQYNDYIIATKEQLKPFQETLLINEKTLNNTKTIWWRNFIYELNSKAKEQLFDKVHEVKVTDSIDIQDLQESTKLQSLNILDYYLTKWIEKINSNRNMLNKLFNDIDYFTLNILNKNTLPINVRNKVNSLIKKAYDCHLYKQNLINDQDFENDINNYEYDTVNGKKRFKIDLCELCLIKKSLQNYECVLMNKTLNEKDDTTYGTWGPKLQENIIRVLYTFVKKEFTICNYEQVVHDGETYLKIIDTLKNEYRCLSKMWSEINNAVNAYDEINICKLRFQLYDDDLYNIVKNDKKSKLLIKLDEYDTMKENFIYELNEAQLKFVRSLGTIKYLKYLKNKTDLEVCPICTLVPTNKYAMLNCGHHMCMLCLSQMIKHNRSKIICSVCRHQEEFKDLFYVTCTDQEDIDNDIKAKGDYPVKILSIIENILKLKKEDKNVKIILFSHWDTVLDVLGKALEANSITYLKKALKFNKKINDFKDKNLNITCLLLPLSYGSKGLNLTEATHLFLIEPIINLSNEKQAIGRIHRIGQLHKTYVHRFIVKNTIEETIHNAIKNDYDNKWLNMNITVENLKELFVLNDDYINSIIND